MSQPKHDDDNGGVGDLVARMTGPTEDDGASRHVRVRDMERLLKAVGSSARRAGRASVLGGAWLVELVLDTAPRLPVRDATTLRAQHPGISDDDLAQTLISGAAKSTAAVGAAGGALAAAELAAPPTLVSVPVQLAAETLLVAAIEIKLIAELHEVYGRPAPGQLHQRTQAYLMSWTERRGFDPFSTTALGLTLGATAKRGLRKRLLKRLGRNLSTLGPVMSGALAGSIVNHRETRRLGDLIRSDLRSSGRTIAGTLLPRP